MTKADYICTNCDKVIPMPKRVLDRTSGMKAMPQICYNCGTTQAPRQSLRPMKPRKK